MDLKNREQRELLCERLTSSRGDVLMRPADDERIIMTSTPKKVIGVIIHKRYWKTKTVTQTNDSSDMCLECTFIKDFGDKTYCSSLFPVSCVSSYITRSVSNIIVSKL